MDAPDGDGRMIHHTQMCWKVTILRTTRTTQFLSESSESEEMSTVDGQDKKDEEELARDKARWSRSRVDGLIPRQPTDSDFTKIVDYRTYRILSV